MLWQHARDMEFRLSIVIYKVYWMSSSSVAEIVVEIILYKLANQSYGAFYAVMLGKLMVTRTKTHLTSV